MPQLALFFWHLPLKRTDNFNFLGLRSGLCSNFNPLDEEVGQVRFGFLATF